LVFIQIENGDMKSHCDMRSQRAARAKIRAYDAPGIEAGIPHNPFKR
jgi:hypothetical protein